MLYPKDPSISTPEKLDSIQPSQLGKKEKEKKQYGL
jgi:hypothetical protein